MPCKSAVNTVFKELCASLAGTKRSGKKAASWSWSWQRQPAGTESCWSVRTHSVFFNTESNLNATFYPEILPPANGISVVTQSGGIGRIIIEELRDEGLGISKWIGVGNRAVLDFSDFVDYLAQDQDTRVITLFIEGTEKGRELMECRRACGSPETCDRVPGREQ